MRREDKRERRQESRGQNRKRIEREAGRGKKIEKEDKWKKR